MAIHKLIELLDTFGIPATQEHNGKWSHTSEYVAVRYGGIRDLIKTLTEKAVMGNAKARLQLALVKDKPLEEIDKIIQLATEVA